MSNPFFVAGEIIRLNVKGQHVYVRVKERSLREPFKYLLVDPNDTTDQGMWLEEDKLIWLIPDEDIERLL